MSEPVAEDRLLDNPAWSALTGPQAHMGERVGRAARFFEEISPFAALDHDADEGAWADAARLGPAALAMVGLPTPPPGWEVPFQTTGIQMLAPDLQGEPDPEAVALGAPDAPEMLDLVARTRPGPFLARSVEFGGYLGIRRDGRLVAMAGQRFRLPGWTEISAVCTDDAVRGTGLAGRLVRAVVAAIWERGDRALLHVASSNTNAIRLYRDLGFVERREMQFLRVVPPGAPRS